MRSSNCAQYFKNNSIEILLLRDIGFQSVVDCTHIYCCSQLATAVCNDDRTYSIRIIHIIFIIRW